MSEITNSLKKHKRQPNMCSQSRMSLEKGKNIGPYIVLDLIKEGSSSKVYLAKSKFTNEQVAIKAISKSPLKNNLEELLLITKQMETLKILKHRNIVTLYEIYESKKYIYLITEYLSGKDLIEKLIRKKRFNEEEALRIFFQLLDAFTYMHKMNICHRNIRTEHILFDKNNRPKIVGFGYSSFYESNKTIEGAFGSLCYTCPEIIDEMPYNPELADVWSLGVILYVLICGYLPFSDEDDNKNKILISNGKIDFPKEISNKLKDLLRHMLDKNPNKRYTFQKIIKHPWIKPYSEKIFSQGINIHETIFPVDERILNIINEYGLDKNKVKNDLILNKYNIGTAIYKQIVRKLLDLKIKNISDLWSEEFVNYRDDEKNKIENGNQKYMNYIEKIDEKYRIKEDFINDFKEREEKVAERLLYLQDKKEEEKNNGVKDKNKLVTIEETITDEGDENLIEKNNKSDNENEIKQKENQNQNQNNIKTVKTQKNRLFPRTKTPMFNFRELKKAKSKNITYNANIFPNILNNDNVQIVYNKDQDVDVDIIQQFKDQQNKKLSENIIIEKPTHKKVPSTPNFGKEADNDSSKISETNPFRLSNTPDKNENIAKKILEKNQNNDINNKEPLKDSNLNTKESLYSNLNINNSLYSNLNNINSGNVNYTQNQYKSIVSGNTLYSFNSNSNNNSKSLFRMTTFKKSNNKNYLSRGSLYDDFLKKNHPDNIRKTMLKKSSLRNKNTINNINEGIKENDESESENDEKENLKEKEKKDIDNELKKSLKLKYSLSFDDDDENEENEEENSLNSKEDDIKLFNILDNENDEELKELKKIYFNEDNDKDKDNNKKEQNKKKSLFKKKSVKFKEEDNEKDKSPTSKFKKSIVSKGSQNSANYNLTNSVLEGLDKYEEKLKEINKNYQITNDKDDGGSTGRIRFDSQLEISFHDDNYDKFRVHLYDDYITFYNDIVPIKKLNINDNDIFQNISDIYYIIQKKYLLKLKKDKPCSKLNIFTQNNNEDFDFNNIDKINEIFIKNKNDKEKNENISNGKIDLDNNDRENNGSMSAEEIKPKEIKEINNPRKDKKRFTGGGTIRNKFIIEKNKKNSKEKYKNKNIPLKKEELIQTDIIEKFPMKKTIQIKENSFIISNNINNGNINTKTNTFNRNYYNNGTYNGNNQIDISKNNRYNGNTYNPNTINIDSSINNNINIDNEIKKNIYMKNNDLNSMRYNQSYSNFSYYMNKDNKINKTLKKYYYNNENKNLKVDTDTLKINKSKYLKPKSPKINKYKDINIDNFTTSDNKKINFNKYDTNKQLQLFKSHYKKYEDMTNNLFYIDEPNFNKTMPKRKAEYNSVKNIKDEVVGKRDEIIEKIQHCQNLLNTIMKEKKLFMTNPKKNLENYSSNTYNYHRGLNPKKSPEKNKSKKKLNNNFENAENLNKEIKQIYIKNKKENKLIKNFTYKRINVKQNQNKKFSADNIIEDKNNKISLPENYTSENTNTYRVRTCLKKNFGENDVGNNNKSFDAQKKEMTDKIMEIPEFPANKLIQLYNKYDNKSYSTNISYRKELTESQSLNKINNINNSKEKQIYRYSKNNFKNQNEESNNKTSKTRKIKGNKTEKNYFK